MRASTLKYTILSMAATLVMLILLLMPFHAFLTVWGSSLVGHYTALRLWKEVLLLVCLAAVGYLLATDHKIRSHTLTRRLVWVVLLYGAVNIGWGIIAYHHHTVSAKALGYGLIVDLRFPTFFLVTWAVALRTSRLRAQWQRLLLWPALVVVAFGLLQAAILPYNFLTHFGYSNATIPPYGTINHNVSYIRIESTLRGANPLGAYLIVPISLLMVLLVRNRRNWAAYGVFLLAALSVLYFSFSRSAWVGAAISVGLVLATTIRSRRTRQWIITVVCLALLVFGGLVFSFRHNVHAENILLHTQTHSAVKTTSDGGHAKAFRNGIHDLMRQPFGRGPGSAGPASVYNNHPTRIAENYYLQIGQETGWIGLLLFLLINGGVGYLLWVRRSDPLALSLFASFIGLSFINMLSHAWADDTLAYVWWGLAGIAMAPIMEKSKQENR